MTLIRNRHTEAVTFWVPHETVLHTPLPPLSANPKQPETLALLLPILFYLFYITKVITA
jgi:hypothetical protein